MDDIKEIIVQACHKWRSADSQRSLFGMNMPQTKNAMKDFYESLQKVFARISRFSLVQKGQKLEAVITDKNAGNIDLPDLNASINIPSLSKVMTELKITSITLTQGVTEEELKNLFDGLNMSAEEIASQDGRKGFLEKTKSLHIKVDQMKFQLLKEEEQVSAIRREAEKALELHPTAALPPKDKDKDIRKLFDSTWNDYLKGKLSEEDFQNHHQDLLMEALKKPEQLVRIIKRLMGKQKEVEKFLANLEQKLFEIGFPQEAIGNLKKKLIKPKRVLIAEDELARLRKIEQDSQKGVGESINKALESVDKIKTKLADEKERSEAILHQIGQGGIVLDNDGKILAVNPVAQNVLGISENEIRGKKIEDVMKGHHLMTMVSDWQNETDAHIPKEVKIKAADDKTLNVIRESVVVVENENGRAVGVISSLQNVTQQEEIQKRKNDILDVIGHDLRAPICAIKQNFSMFLDSINQSGSLDSQQEKFRDLCKRNIERTERLVEKILDLRQMETGKIILKYSDADMNRLVEEAADSFNSWVKDKKIQLQVKAEKMPNVQADPERIYQVITNFISNALKFTPEEGSIIVSGKPVTIDGHQYAEVSVKDSGMGIRQEDLGRIFNKYEQVSFHAPKGVSGLGLGLAICKAVIELHGGKIWAESEPEAGSTFTFQIPVLENKGEDQ